MAMESKISMTVPTLRTTDDKTNQWPHIYYQIQCILFGLSKFSNCSVASWGYWNGTSRTVYGVKGGWRAREGRRSSKNRAKGLSPCIHKSSAPFVYILNIVKICLKKQLHSLKKNPSNNKRATWEVTGRKWEKYFSTQAIRPHFFSPALKVHPTKLNSLPLFLHIFVSSNFQRSS